MKRKISIILLLFTFIATNVQASIFNSVISIFSAKPAFKETDKSLHIYEDTQNHWCNFAAARLYNEGIFKGIQIGDKNYFMPVEPKPPAARRVNLFISWFFFFLKQGTRQVLCQPLPRLPQRLR